MKTKKLKRFGESLCLSHEGEVKRWKKKMLAMRVEAGSHTAKKHLTLRGGIRLVECGVPCQDNEVPSWLALLFFKEVFNVLNIKKAHQITSMGHSNSPSIFLLHLCCSPCPPLFTKNKKAPLSPFYWSIQFYITHSSPEAIKQK